MHDRPDCEIGSSGVFQLQLVTSKARAVLEVGMLPFYYHLPADTEESQLVSLLHKLNVDEGPVKISRFAIDGKAPHSDLYISPGHANSFVKNSPRSSYRNSRRLVSQGLPVALAVTARMVRPVRVEVR
jgi:hypothetical protein